MTFKDLISSAGLTQQNIVSLTGMDLKTFKSCLSGKVPTQKIIDLLIKHSAELWPDQKISPDFLRKSIALLQHPLNSHVEKELSGLSSSGINYKFEQERNVLFDFQAVRRDVESQQFTKSFDALLRNVTTLEQCQMLENLLLLAPTYLIGSEHIEKFNGQGKASAIQIEVQGELDTWSCRYIVNSSVAPFSPVDISYSCNRLEDKTAYPLYDTKGGCDWVDLRNLAAEINNQCPITDEQCPSEDIDGEFTVKLRQFCKTLNDRLVEENQTSDRPFAYDLGNRPVSTGFLKLVNDYLPNLLLIRSVAVGDNYHTNVYGLRHILEANYKRLQKKRAKISAINGKYNEGGNMKVGTIVNTFNGDVSGNVHTGEGDIHNTNNTPEQEVRKELKQLYQMLELVRKPDSAELKQLRELSDSQESGESFLAKVNRAMAQLGSTLDQGTKIMDSVTKLLGMTG